MKSDYPKADVSSPIGNTVTILKAHRKVHVKGIDYGPKLTFHGENKSFLILKIGGHTAWAGRGQTAYYAGRFAVFQIKKRTEDSTCITYDVEPVVDFTQKQES